MVRFSCVPRLVSVTCAFGMTAPLASVTVPRISAVVNWPNANEDATSSGANTIVAFRRPLWNLCLFWPEKKDTTSIISSSSHRVSASGRWTARHDAAQACEGTPWSEGVAGYQERITGIDSSTAVRQLEKRLFRGIDSMNPFSMEQLIPPKGRLSTKLCGKVTPNVTALFLLQIRGI